ncbi:MAG: PAS domain-containing protein [Gammaproteobacteria bacterium]|nr:PAS domain-containing protein [Gammaproteobacteria bacterium]
MLDTKQMKSNDARLEYIISAVRHAIADDWAVAIPEEGNDKISELAKALNGLLSAMRSKIEDVECRMESLAGASVRMSLVSAGIADIRAADDGWRHGGEIRDLYLNILDSLMELTGVDYGALAIFSEDGKIMDFVTQGSSAGEINNLTTLPSGHGLLGAFYREGKVMRVDNVAPHPQSCGFPKHHPVMESLLGVPIKVRGVVRGVVYLSNKPGGRKFSASDEEVLNMFSREVAEILERNELLDTLKKDIEERNKVQENLIRTSGRLQYLIDNTPAIIYSSVPSGDFKITFVSENMTRVLGYETEEMISENDFWFNHIHPDDVSHVFEKLPYLFEEGQQTYEYRFRHKNGSHIWVHDTLRLVHDNEEGKVLEIVGSMTDITERKKIEHALNEEKEQQKSLISQLQEAQSQLLQSEKMASIGQLAAGVAHEINNPVGYVSSNLGSLSKYIEDIFKVVDAYEKAEPILDSDRQILEGIRSIKKDVDIEFLKVDVMELIKESVGGVRRVKEIVQDLKDFSHVDEAEWQTVDLHKGLDSTLNIVHNEIKYKAKIVKEYGDLPLVECLASQLNQVFMNLLVNAAHAIEERGIISIRTGTKDDQVWVEVSDTGKGIPPENLNRIFEPFFTTKPVGKGTGLGLSLSYGIVMKHGGNFEVQSEVGKGTNFKVWLPVRQKIEQNRITTTR